MLARVTLGWITDEQTGKTVQNRVPIGTFKTKKEAVQALAEYGANPYDIQNNNLTLAELYQKWTESYFPTLESESSSRTITAAWRYCHAIHSMCVKDLRAGHIKGIMEDGYIIPSRGKDAGHKVPASPGTKARVKSMFNLMPEFVDWILIQCYMGWRPQELAKLRIDDVNLSEQYITGGMKTDAGKNRVVPIHPRIKSLVQKNNTPNKFMCYYAISSFNSFLYL